MDDFITKDHRGLDQARPASNQPGHTPNNNDDDDFTLNNDDDDDDFNLFNLTPSIKDISANVKGGDDDDDDMICRKALRPCQ